MNEINPWLEIPASDYEGHMEQVGQLQLLNRLFREVAADIKPKAIAVLGCTTGNGFEHIDFLHTTKAVGIDINPAYLELARQRFRQYAGQIEWRCSDLQIENIGEQEFDLIHGALLFEYIALDVVLPKIHHALRPTGLLSVVLQLPTQTLPAVSATPYTSLGKLAPMMKLLTAEKFRASAKLHRFLEVQGQSITLPSGKTFFVARYRLE